MTKPDYRLLVRPGGFIDSRDAERVEGVLATARFIMAVTALVAIYIDPTEPTRYYLLAYSLLFAYVLYSGAVLAVLSFLNRFPRVPAGLFIVDVIWITVLTAFTQGPNSPFFVFFTFVLVSSAYRWGFGETLATGIILGILFIGQGVFVARTFGDGALLDGQYDVNRFIMRSAYLLIITI